MNRFPDFSGYSRSLEESRTEKVSLHVDDGPALSTGVLFQKNGSSQLGTVTLTVPSDSMYLLGVNYLLGTEREYSVTLEAVNADMTVTFRMGSSQHLED